MRDFLNIKHLAAQFPKKRVGLRGPELVPEQNDAVRGKEGFHGRDQVRDGFLDVNDVGGYNEIEGRVVEGVDLSVVVPVEDGVFEVFAEEGLVDLEVALQCGHHGCDVGEDYVRQAQ